MAKYQKVVKKWRIMEQRISNFTQVPNVLLERLAKSTLSAQELRVCLVVLRKTFGWGKLEDAISYSQFSLATGISRRSVARVIVNLVSSGTLVLSTTPGKTNIYSFVAASELQSTTTSAVEGTKLVSPTSPTKETPQNIDESLLSITDEVVSSLATKHGIAETDVRKKLEDLRVYCKSSGKRYRDYPSALEVFILRGIEEKKIIPIGEAEQEYEQMMKGERV